MPALSDWYRPVVPWPADSRAVPDYGSVWVMGVAADPRTGHVYVFQRSKAHPMLVFDRAGRFLRSWGAGRFTDPHGCRMAADGTLWLTDDGDDRAIRTTTDGRVLATLGVRFHAGNDATHFNRPADVALAPDGSLYVADGYGNARVVHLDAGGRFLGAWGRHGTGRSEFHLVHSIVYGPDSRVYVADRENRRVQVFTPDGRWLAVWTDVGYPFGLALTPEGRLVITDGVADTVSLYDLSGRRVARFGGAGTAPGRFRRPHLCGIDPSDGALYVTEVFGRRVQKFVPLRR